MKSQVLHTVWCHISCEAAGEFWHWSLSEVKGLSAGQTDATCCMQHCWIMLQHVEQGWPNERNIVQHGGQTHATCCVQQCCTMLRQHVASVWPGLMSLGSFPSADQWYCLFVYFSLQSWKICLRTSDETANHPAAEVTLRSAHSPRSTASLNSEPGSRGRHRGNTYLTSLPLVSVRRHGRETQWKSRKNFTTSASSIFLVHNVCCDKCI